jgi:cell division septum initiation protein DivIVA
MSLSESASAQVQAILQAAEAGAEQIKAEAQAEAERIRAAARDSKQADLSGVLALAASLREDLDALEARLRELADGEPAPAPAPAQDAAPDAAPAAVEEDTEGARLIALNMALNGEAREDTDRYLAENFDLADRAALLDEVYASVEG